jgi:hypothetical protein
VLQDPAGRGKTQPSGRRQLTVTRIVLAVVTP